MKRHPSYLILLLAGCLLVALGACDRLQPSGTVPGAAPLPTSQPRSGPPPGLIVTGSTYFSHQPGTSGESLIGFGRSVDVSLATLVVGAANFTAGQSGQDGTVFVYQRTGLTWDEDAQLTASSASPPGQRFGHSVSVDVGWIAVGAPDAAHPQAGSSAGAVYLFEQLGGVWTEVARLESPAPAAGAQFGSRVELAGPWLAAGGAPDSGVIDIFQLVEREWRPAARLSAADQGLPPGTFFGASLAMSGERLAVGVLPAAGEAAARPGSVSIFQNGPNGWQPAGQVQSEVTADAFGAAVALQGDLLAVGAPADPDGDYGAGAVYLFAYNGVEWLRLTKLLAADASPQAAFGSAIALQDGLLAVGAPFSDRKALNGGVVYVFQQQGQNWADRMLLEPVEAYPLGDLYGSELALHSGTLAVAAPGEFGSAAYAYEIVQQ